MPLPMPMFTPRFMPLSRPLDTALDETPIPGTLGSKIYWFEDFVGRETIKQLWLQAIQRMPPQHMPFVCSVVVPRALPGHITTHGGTYGANWHAVWSRESAVETTGVPEEFLDTLRESNPLHRLVGIPCAKAADAAASPFTLLHELGHSVSHSRSLVPPNATVEDFPGVHYPRSPGNVEELAVEAYARSVLRRTNIVWKAETRAAFHAAHPNVGRRPGDGVLTPEEIDARYEAICRASLARSPAML